MSSSPHAVRRKLARMQRQRHRENSDPMVMFQRALWAMSDDAMRWLTIEHGAFAWGRTLLLGQGYDAAAVTLARAEHEIDAAARVNG